MSAGRRELVYPTGGRGNERAHRVRRMRGRILAVARKVYHTLRHDKRSIGLMVVAPIVAMLVFGYAFGSEVGEVPVLVVNEDEGGLADQVLSHMDSESIVVASRTDRKTAEAEVKSGDYKGLYYFPADFTANATPGMPESQEQPGPLPPVGGEQPARPTPPPGSTVEIYVDGANSQVAAVVVRSLAEAIQATFEEEGAAPISVETRYAHAEGAEFMDFFVPGIMAFAALMFTTLLTLLAFVGERTSGTLSRMLVTPVREWEIVAGYALAFGVIASVQGAILLGVALLIFDVLVVGSLALAFFTVALMGVNAMSLGILLSAAAEREAQAVQMLPLIVFPTFLLSGIFVPLEALPAWLQPFAWAIPPTYAVEALRDIMLRGWGLSEVWPHLAALAGFAAAFLGLAVLGLKRQRA